MNDLTTLIGSYGFPIVACAFMYRFCTETVKENTKAINKLAIIIAKFEGKLDKEDKEAKEREGM
jgi:hypothetical protein